MVSSWAARATARANQRRRAPPSAELPAWPAKRRLWSHGERSLDWLDPPTSLPGVGEHVITSS